MLLEYLSSKLKKIAVVLATLVKVFGEIFDTDAAIESFPNSNPFKLQVMYMIGKKDRANKSPIYIITVDGGIYWSAEVIQKSPLYQSITIKIL